MEHRFDTLAKAVAGGLSRRAALRGLTGAVLASVGVRQAVAREDRSVEAVAATPPTICVRPFELTVRAGPSAGLQLRGVLALNVAPSGSIDQGTLLPWVGSGVKVTGQANGRAINLLFDLGNGNLVYGVGTLEHDIGACSGALGGPLVGPQPGDSGDWGFDFFIVKKPPPLTPEEICGRCVTACKSTGSDNTSCSNGCHNQGLC